MTEEQIKQNAKNFAINETGGLAIKYFPCEKGYIAGAHSRDEEIKELQKENLYMESLLSMHRKMTGEYELKLQKLRNPWINASKQLPPEDKEGSNLSIDCLVMAGDGNSFFYVIAWYDYSGKCWYEKYDFDQTHLDGNKVYYWMELPKCNHIEIEGGNK